MQFCALVSICDLGDHETFIFFTLKNDELKLHILLSEQAFSICRACNLKQGSFISLHVNTPIPASASLDIPLTSGSILHNLRILADGNDSTPMSLSCLPLLLPFASSLFPRSLIIEECRIRLYRDFRSLSPIGGRRDGQLEQHTFKSCCSKGSHFLSPIGGGRYGHQILSPRKKNTQRNPLLSTLISITQISIRRRCNMVP